MWTMGYNDGGEFNLPDSCNGSRKLRPFVSRQMASPAGNNSSTSGSPCLGRLHNGTDFFALNHHLAMADKREFNTQPVVMSSTRWNPTPEQLRTLEELYRRGTRTPTADQIQHITAQLRRYGKIEGKNVFYWFQNHKARERQKRRRQRDTAPTDNINEQQQNRDNNTDNFERKDTGASRTGYEGEQTKNWARSTNCSTLSEEAAAILLQQREAKAAGVAECRAEGWMQLDEGELQHRRGFMERNATLQMMQLSCLTTTSSTATATRTSTAMAATPRPRPTPPSAAAKIRAMEQKVIMAGQDLNIFIAPYHKDNGGQGVLINHFSNNGSAINEGHGRGDSPTLQLFPLRSGGHGSNNDGINEKETEISVAAAAMNANNLTPPFQFFEFLPLKNQ